MFHRPKITIALDAFGGIAIFAAVVFLGISFYLENEIGRAFALGAFFSGIIGSILLLGFAKVIQLLDTIRQQTEQTLEKANNPENKDE